MNEVVAFTDLMLALRTAVLQASTCLNSATEKILAGYFETNTKTPKTIAISHNSGEQMQMPLLAITPLAGLGINSASFNLNLLTRTDDNVVWVNLSKRSDETSVENGWKKIDVSLVVNPDDSLAVFLKTVERLERQISIG